MGMKKDILQKIEQQLRWYSHVMQMEDCRIARQVAEWTPQQSSQYMEGWD
jgi:hypothetical protein